MSKTLQLPLEGKHRYLEIQVPEKLELSELPDILLSVLTFLKSCSVVSEMELDMNTEHEDVKPLELSV